MRLEGKQRLLQMWADLSTLVSCIVGRARRNGVMKDNLVATADREMAEASRQLEEWPSQAATAELRMAGGAHLATGIKSGWTY